MYQKGMVTLLLIVIGFIMIFLLLGAFSTPSTFEEDNLTFTQIL